MTHRSWVAFVQRDGANARSLFIPPITEVILKRLGGTMYSDLNHYLSSLKGRRPNLAVVECLSTDWIRSAIEVDNVMAAVSIMNESPCR